MKGASAGLKSTGLRPTASTLIRCWFGPGLGRGSEVCSFRFFSNPPSAEAYFQTRIVDGSVASAIVQRPDAEYRDASEDLWRQVGKRPA
jgi:hypothetical protein